MEQQARERRNDGGSSRRSILLAVVLALAAVVYAVSRVMQDRAYDEKWSDYDECGLS